MSNDNTITGTKLPQETLRKATATALASTTLPATPSAGMATTSVAATAVLQVVAMTTKTRGPGSWDSELLHGLRLQGRRRGRFEAE